MQQKNLIEYYNEYSVSTRDIGDDPEERVPLIYFDCQLLGNYPKEIEIKHSAYRQRLRFLSNYGDHHVVLQLRFGLFIFRPTIYIRLYKSFTLTENDIENYIRISNARRKRRTSLRP